MSTLQKYINYIDEKMIGYLYFANSTNEYETSDYCKVSVCIMTYNEERCIERCIRSVWNIADEIIVVDTGSTDNTLNILDRFKEKLKVYQFSWNQNFAEVRNKMIEKASNPVVFQIDADEYLQNENESNVLKQIIAFTYSKITIPFAISPIIEDSNGHKYYQTRRIFPNIPEMKYYGDIHEELRVNNKEIPPNIEINIVLQHDGYETEIMEKKDKFERNINLLRGMVEKHPDSVRWNYFMARDLLFKNELAKEALDYLKRALVLIKTQKKNYEYEEGIYVLMGQVFMNLKDCESLSRIVQVLTKKYERNIDRVYFELEIIRLNICEKFDAINNILKYLNDFREFNSFIHSEGEHVKKLLIMLEYCSGNYNITSLLCEEAEKSNINLDDIYARFRDKYIEQQKYLFKGK